MNMDVTLSHDVVEHLQNLELGSKQDLSEKVRLLLIAEYRRRLARYHLANEQLSQKYNMNFEAFEQQQMTRQQGYSWEVESDAISWETAVDGMATVQRQLKELTVKD